MSHHSHAAPAEHHDTADQPSAQPTPSPDGRVRHQNEQGLGVVNEQGVRAPVAAPEANLVAPVETPLMPPPLKEVPKIPQAVADAANEPLFGSEKKDVRVSAEEALAAVIHKGLEGKPSLRHGLKLDVLPVVGYGATGLKLCLHGPQVTTNAPELNEALIGANNGLLSQHPVLSKFFHNVAELPKIEATSDNMYHVIIPMSVDVYKQTLQALAGEPAQVAVQSVSSPVTPMPLALPETVQAATAASAPELAAAVPQTVVQTPIAALEKAANDPEIAPQGVAR